jgi:predicted HicB family RNase H-like nuclease
MSVLRIYAAFAIIILGHRDKPAPAIESTKRRGKAIRASIFKMPRVLPRHIKFAKSSRPSKGSDVKTKPIDHYTYRVTWSEEDREHVGLCAEFPGLSWLDASPEAALRGIRRVVSKVVKDMQSTGEAIPESLATRRFSGKFMVRVPPEIHRQLAIEAAEAGVSLNRLASAKLS